MMVTVSTVGYGDITPSTDLGRIAAMAMIAFAIISVPQMTNELIEKMNLQSVYARAKYVARGGISSHVIVCGNMSSTALHEFFAELYHDDHENSELLDCVILQPDVPTFDVLMLLKDPKVFLHLTYLEGNPLNDKDLHRAQAASARAIFILTNKFASNPDEEDAKTILQQFSIQRFIRLHSLNTAMDIMHISQLIRPENRRHLVTSEKDGHSGQDLVICLNEIKMGIIAKAIVFPVSSSLDHCYLSPSNLTIHLACGHLYRDQIRSS
jgi:hypothetical protein